MLVAEQLDGHANLLPYIGQEVDHAIGTGTILQFKSGTYTILIDLPCENCGKTYPFFLFDGPSTSDWAYARETEHGPTLDLRNQILLCSEKCDV